MPRSDETFGRYLYEFILAIDIVDNHTFDQLWTIVKNYLRDYLNVDYVSLKLETLVDDKMAGLRTVRGSHKGQPFYTLEKDGQPSGQTSYSFMRRTPLWIVDANEGLLSSGSAKHVDLWSNADDFPKSPKLKRRSITTSIFVPIEHEERVVGIVEFESKHYIEATELAKQEFKRIAETISKAYLLCDSNEARSENTTAAIDRLRRSLDKENWRKLTKPQIFIASAGKGDDAVVGRIRTVLEKFGDRINVVYWKDSSESGDINQQILDQISKSKFGLCYFSEPVGEADGKKYKYRDNPNVVFEAGMLQSLTNSPTSEPTGWIPVRENASPKAPFDFAATRMLIVDRLNTGELNTEAFSNNLKSRVTNLLNAG